MFKNATFGQIVSESRKVLVAVAPNLKISAALELLSVHQILHLPITSHSNPLKIVAIVGILDLVSYVLEDLTRLESPVESCLTLDPDDESYLVFEKDYTDSIEKTLDAFGKRLHRVLVSDALGVRLPTLLSQTDLIKFAYGHLESLDFGIDLQGALGLYFVKKEVVALDVGVSAYDGLLKLVKSRVPALAILENGKSVGAALSSADFRGFVGQSLNVLQQPVLDFLKTVRPEFQGKFTTVTFEVSVKDTLQLFVERKLHRVWIVDQSDPSNIIGVVSQSDLLSVLSK